MGQNGREIPAAAPAFPTDTDLLIVMLGVNDLLQGRSPEQAAERLEHFLSGISPDRKKLLLIAPPPVTRGEWVLSKQLIDDSHAFAQSGSGGANGHPLCRCWQVEHFPCLRRRTLHRAGTQSLCSRTFEGAQMKRIWSLFISLLLLLTGCGGNTSDGSYHQITQGEAKEMMDTRRLLSWMCGSRTNTTAATFPVLFFCR